MMDDFINFDGLRVPYVEIHEDPENPYNESEVHTKMVGSFEIPDLKVRNFKEELVSSKEEEAKKNNKSFFDGSAMRLKKYTIDDSNHQVYLDLEKTSFFTYAATNKSTDKEPVKTMLKERGDSYQNLDDGLANPIGVNNVLLSRPDNSVVIMQRSPNLAVYPDCFGVPAGFFNSDKDGISLYRCSSREIKEESGVGISKSEMLGFGRDEDRHFEFLMLTETEWPVEKIKAAPKSAKWESSQIYYIDFEPRPVMKYLTKTIDGKTVKWVPSQWNAVMKALVRKYGFDDVWDAYQNIK